MRNLIITISIIFIATVALSAEFIVEVDVDWSNGKQVAGGLWTGARAIVPSARCFDTNEAGNNCLKYDDSGVTRSSFSWVDLDSVEKAKAGIAEVYITTSPAKLKKMAEEGAPGSRKHRIKKLRNPKAKAKKPGLPADNNGD